VHLAKLVLRDMAARGAGKVLFTSSIVAAMPGSHQSVYNASKSLVQSFAEARHDELRDPDVTITSLMPGSTDTNFFRRAGMEDTRVGRMPKDDPAGSPSRLPSLDGRRKKGSRGVPDVQGDGAGQPVPAGLGQGGGEPADRRTDPTSLKAGPSQVY
jgi:NAD(P)-dependent dehydrogenase (short-subunit alcohol dehydrogenase family)